MANRPQQWGKMGGDGTEACPMLLQLLRDPNHLVHQRCGKGTNVLLCCKAALLKLKGFVPL